MTSNASSLALAVALGLVLPLVPAAVRAQGTPPTAPAAPAAPTAPPASTAGKVATVNGVAIPKARVDMVVKSQAARGVPDSEQLRGEVKEQLIVREIVAQEASKKGLGKNADVQAQLELARQQVMWAAFVADFVKTNPVSDAQLKAEYERLRVSRGDKEYKTAPHPGRERGRGEGGDRRAQEGPQVRGTGKAVEGPRLEGQGRRSRLELAGRLT